MDSYRAPCDALRSSLSLPRTRNTLASSISGANASLTDCSAICIVSSALALAALLMSPDASPPSAAIERKLATKASSSAMTPPSSISLMVSSTLLPVRCLSLLRYSETGPTYSFPYLFLIKVLNAL